MILGGAYGDQVALTVANGGYVDISGTVLVGDGGDASVIIRNGGTLTIFGDVDDGTGMASTPLLASAARARTAVMPLQPVIDSIYVQKGGVFNAANLKDGANLPLVSGDLQVAGTANIPGTLTNDGNDVHVFAGGRLNTGVLTITDTGTVEIDAGIAHHDRDGYRRRTRETDEPRECQGRCGP